MTELDWPRARNWEWRFGPLGIHLFRNPDAGVTLSVDFIVSSNATWKTTYFELFRFGPGQCGERTYHDNRWCLLPFGHDSDHRYDPALAARA